MNHDDAEFDSAPHPSIGDPFAVLRASDTPGWDAPVAPDPAFAARLRDRLERGVTLPKGILMSNNAITESEAAISAPAASPVERPGALPYLTVRGAQEAIDWYRENLGARLRGEPIVMDDNRIGHAELEIGDGVLYLADEFADLGLRAPQPGHVSVSLMLPVADTDEALIRAQRGGAAVTREPYDAHGTRSATIIDPFGHRWMLTGPARIAADVEPVRVGDIVYLSLQTPDRERAARFYGAVLGWEYDPETRQVTNIGHRLGIFDGDGYGTAGTLYCVYAVEDFDRARAAILAAGGRVGEISTVARDGYLVMDAVDDQGVAFSVHVPDPGETRGEQHPRTLGAMSYLTIATPDSARYRDFYGAVMNWRFTPGRIDDGWEVDGVHPQIGIAGGADRSVAEPMWNVADVDEAVERVRAAGGTVLEEPNRQAYGAVARCTDDQGARFYLGQLF
ncbi:VOC family protein [Gordonia polyisoprenivorans]|uniref:VOC family protein n=1 Tax=Gordonia polyisoprenivorans TaxID=84595 RepID=UPI001AD72959|nr:VOC family protein [Gordonia polyisoprenivorans]QTI68694.1 VOC family protein [Gordonia polyisoprenivorans]